MARLDALNTSINLRPIESVERNSGAAFELHFKKARDCHGDEIASLRCKLSESEKGFLNWEWQPVEESAEERLLALIEDNGGVLSVKEASLELDVTAGRISHLKKELIKKGLLKKDRMLRLISKVERHAD